MKNKFDISQVLFFAIVACYLFLYVPFGINETDGGFITAYAWRLINGEQMFSDIIYVRPPMSVWLRSLELYILPDQFEILAERIFFYLKVALYSYLGSKIIFNSPRRWTLATIGFIVSVHSYPAAAWHTVDGILFSVIAMYLFFQKYWGIIPAAIAVVCAALCKQSFYPLIPGFVLLCFVIKNKKEAALGIGTLMISLAAFYFYLKGQGTWDAFLALSSGSTKSGDAIQRGIIDYFRIDVKFLAISSLLIALVIPALKPYRLYAWIAFLTLLIFSYPAAIYTYQESIAPFGHVRLLFDIAVIFIGYKMFTHRVLWRYWFKLLSVLAISWMAAISWGFNTPLLFSVPYIGALFLLTDDLIAEHPNWQRKYLNYALLIALLCIFRFAYEYIYRDGKRSEMIYDLSTVFPKLNGIYTDEDSFNKYEELKKLWQKYGNNFKTLPSFPLANYLTDTQSPVPLDWVIQVETNGNNDLIYQKLKSNQPFIFIEKSYGENLLTKDNYEATKHVLERFRKIETNNYFDVYQ